MSRPGSTTTTEPTEVLIVDDDPSIGQFIERCLAGAGYAVSGIVASADAAVERIQQRLPSLVLIDIRLEGATDGIALAERIRAEWNLPIVYVTGHGDGAVMERVVKSEPHGYVSKPFDEAQLRGAVELALSVAERERKRERELQAVRGYASELQASATVMEGRLGQIADVLRDSGVVRLDLHRGLPPDIAAKIQEMSRRELEVLQFLLSSRRVASIARELQISAYTVRNHLRSVFRKLGVHSQTELLDMFRGISTSAMAPVLRIGDRT